MERSKTGSCITYLIDETKKTREERYAELEQEAREDRAYDLACEKAQAKKEICKDWDSGQEG